MKNKFLIPLIIFLSMLIFSSCHNTVVPTMIEPPDDNNGNYPGKILFTSDITGKRQLYTIKPDGTELKQLTNNGGWDPKWSPDGRQIVFTSTFTSPIYPAIYIMNSDGSNLHLLPVAPGQQNSPFDFRLYEGYNADWSPDGTRIVYVHSSTDNQIIYHFEIMIDTLSSGRVFELKNTNVRSDDHSPKWSPDGKKIAFVSNRDSVNDNGNITDLYIMNSDGKNIKRLTTFGSYIYFFWNPFDQTIFFTSGRTPEGSITTQLYQVDTSGNVQKLTNVSEVIAGTLSNDGNSIAFSSQGVIWILNLNNKNMQRVEVTGNSVPLLFHPVDWSPDDKELLVGSVTLDFKQTFMDMVNISTGRQRRILPDNTVGSFQWYKH